MLMLLFSWVVHCLLILLSVAFFTLFERKIMGLFHNRIGPNKVSFIGLLQPVLDAMKLLTKQTFTPLMSNKWIYNIIPHMSLMLSLMIWMVFPFFYFFGHLNYSLIMFYCLSSVLVLFTLFMGWSSNSKYSLIGSLRSIAQSISYEAVLSTMFVFICFSISSFSFSSFFTLSSLVGLFYLPLWFICILAETHRAPFDFSESESELVSGFNTEYSGTYFAFIFLSEYSMLLLSCFIISLMFVPFSSLNMQVLTFVSMFISFIFIWIRITFCRFRYDLLMILAWKTLLPFSLLFLFIFLVTCYF